MLATGMVLAALTIPLVGLQTWVDWLHVGREATQVYDVDENWITMSRDLLCIPRRWLIDFAIPIDKRDGSGLAPLLLGWGLLLGVLEVTSRLTLLRLRTPAPATGPGASFVLLGAWLTCYHFMYYDLLLAALPVALLFTEPRHYLEPIYHGSAEDRSKGNVSLLNRAAPTILVLLIATQALWVAQPGKIVPGDTLLLLILWAWSGWTWVRESARATT